LYFAYHSCVASCYTAAIHGFYDKDDFESSLGIFCEDLEDKEFTYMKTLDFLDDYENKCRVRPL